MSEASLVAALRSALDVLAPLESSIFLHFSSIIPGMGMILLLVCRAAVMSGRISIQRTSVLLCLEEIHAGRDPSAKLGMLYIRFPTKIKALTQINLKKKKKRLAVHIQGYISFSRVFQWKLDI